MTCILGIETKEGVWMGADSSSVAGDFIEATNLLKVFKIGKFLIGYTSSFRMGQLLQYSLRVKEQPKLGMTNIRYMVTVFIPAVRKLLEENGYTKISDNVESGGQFLVAYNGELYEIDIDFQVNSFISGVHAIGSGGEFAKASALAYMDCGHSPVDAINNALASTAKHISTVCEPFDIIYQEKESWE